MMRVPGKL